MQTFESYSTPHSSSCVEEHVQQVLVKFYCAMSEQESEILGRPMPHLPETTTTTTENKLVSHCLSSHIEHAFVCKSSIAGD